MPGMFCTLAYCKCAYVLRLGSGKTNQVLEEGQKQDGAGLGWAGGHTLLFSCSACVCSLTAAPDYQDAPRVQEPGLPGELGDLGRDHRDSKKLSLVCW